MNKEQQLIWLRRLREDLRQGDMEKLSSDVEAMGLEALLAPDFLTLARRHNAHQVVILIASLGASNSDEPAKYVRLLAVFQFFTGTTDLSTAAELSSDGSKNSINFYTELLKTIEDKKYKPTFTRTIATIHDLEFAIGILIDLDRSTTSIDLLKLWKKIEHTDIPWLKTCKELSSRVSEVSLQSEALHLAHTIERIIDLAPKTQKKAIQEMRVQWATISLKSKDPVISLKSTKAALENDRSHNQIYNHAKALILNGKYSIAIEEITKLINACTKDSLTMNPESSLNKPVHFDLNAAKETLSHVNKLLISKNLKPFLISGTLLGYARNNDLLPHDKDIDLGIIGWEDQFTIAQALLQSGHYKFDLSQLTGKNRFLISANDLRTGIAIDFFLFHEKQDHFIHGIDFDVGFTQNYKFSKFEPKSVNFLNEEFFVPSDIDKNLTENYGDWKTPDVNYVVTIESPALIHSNADIKHLLIHLELLRNIRKNIRSEKTQKILNILKKTPYGNLSTAIEEKILQHLNQSNWMHRLTQEANP